MKKQLLTLAAALTMTMSAQAALNFDDYVCDPAEGDVTELSTIKITFPNAYDLDINEQDAIMMLCGWDDVELKRSTVSGNVLTITCAEPQTQPGEYTIILGEAALCAYDEDYNSVDSPEFYVVYNISGGGSGEETDFSFDNYTVNPEEGVVTELSKITVNFPDAPNLEMNASDMITVTRNGEDVNGFKVKASDNNFTLTFTEPVTEAGNYIITLGNGAITSFDDDYTSWLDLDQEIIIRYTIEGAAEELDFSNVAMPLNGSITGELSEVTLTFPALAYVTADAAKTTVTVGGEALAADKYQVANQDQNSDYANTITVSFPEAIVATTSTVVKVTFEAGALTAAANQDETATGTNANPVEYVITVAPVASETLVINLSSPTKPNADGEISAEKQLDAFYFNVEMAGLEVVPTEVATVTIKEETDADDAYYVSTKLEKAYGLNSNFSYFSAATSGEPRYNGTYTITIQKHAIADALWLSNDMYGYTNDVQTLTFTLVDGKDRASVGITDVIADDATNNAVYNLQGIRVNGNLDTLPAGIYIVNGKKVIK